MSKPIIGVTPLVDDEKESLWMLPGYMNGIEQAGGLPIMLPLTTKNKELEQLANMCDGFLFTGGHDVTPNIYRKEKLSVCGDCCIARDEMEKLLFSLILRMDKPVLGICRGIQLINACLGGNLYQDLPTQKPSNVEHHQTPPYDIPIHEVKIVENSPLYKLLKTNSLMVNSYHHQAIKEIAPTLKAMAYAPDGLIEAVYLPDKYFVWALQWHPEFSFEKDEASRKIFACLVEVAKNRF